MEYIKGKYASFIFWLINVLVYCLTVDYFLQINYATISFGIFTFVIYYLFEIYYLEDSKYKIDLFMITFWINLILLFAMFLIGISDSLTALYIYIILFSFQVGAKFTILNFFIKNKNILILGKNYKNELIINTIDEGHLYNCVGFISSKISDENYFLGIPKDLKKIVTNKRVSKIVITEEGVLEQSLLETLLDLKLKGIQIFDYLTFYEKIMEKVPVKDINEEWFLFKQGFDILHDRFQKNLKRIIDIILALIMFIPAIPVIIISAIIIKIESKGPIFFIQERIGLANFPFKIVKLRSMRIHNESEFSKYASENDERITTYGNFMRKTRIDELPQLWNVLKGDMSFIGPRAEWVALCRNYMKDIPFYNLRHSVRPGLTGWAQVNYPYGASIEDAFEKLQYDLYYIRHQSLTIDIVIFIKTLKTVIFGKGR